MKKVNIDMLSDPRNMFRVIDELDDFRLQKCIRGPLINKFIITDQYSTPIQPYVFTEKEEAFYFLQKEQQEELSRS